MITMGNKYIKTAGSLYVNYILFGMVNIILASHMSFLTEQLNTDKAGISYLVAAMGMGRLATLYISGVLSDRFGRKPFIIAAGLLMVTFLAGIPLSPSYEIAIGLAVLAGVANSLLDSGTYPALMEAFPRSPGSATVLVRGVISIGSTLLPLMIVFFMNHDIFYGAAFFIPASFFLVNALFLLKMKFPNQNQQESRKVQEAHLPKKLAKPRFWQEGIAIILIGFSGPALLYIVQLWLPTFGQQIIGMSEASSLKLLSYYSMGSLVSVGTLVVVLHRYVKPVTVTLIYPIISILAISSLIVFKAPIITVISSFIIGFSISGILQLGLTVMGEFFGEKKGQITGLIYTATSVAYTVIPLVTGSIIKSGNIMNIFIIAIFINFIGICLAVFVNCRYAVVFSQNSVWLRFTTRNTIFGNKDKLKEIA
jgi:MFS family permease